MPPMKSPVKSKRVQRHSVEPVVRFRSPRKRWEYVCDNVDCRGGVDGCNGTECRNAKWRFCLPPADDTLDRNIGAAPPCGRRSFENR